MADTPPPPPPALTAEQAAAAHAPLDEALVLIAAAGTGKTSTMLERVAFAVEQGVPPEAVLVLTFSRKAAGEFGARLRGRLPGCATTVGTFHSWCWGLLRGHWREAGFSRRPSIAADEEQLLSLMRDVIV